MTSVGRVVAINNECVTVSVKRKGACGDNCASCSVVCNQIVNVTAICDLNVKIGDTVTVETKSKYVYFALLMIFVLPVIFPIVAYFAFLKINNSLAILTSVIAFCFALVSVFLLGKNKQFSKHITPVVISVNN